MGSLSKLLLWGQVCNQETYYTTYFGPQFFC